MTALKQNIRHEARRTAYAFLKPRRMASLRRQRAQDSDRGYSFKPFDRTRSIFVHIPKAAGVSITRSLYGNLGGGHTTIRQYQLIFSAADFYEYFKFTFVRNPWDRLFSAYTFLKSGGMGDLDQEWSARYLPDYPDFEQFVMKGMLRPEVMGYTHFLPQTYFMRSFNGDYPMNFVGFFEQIVEDFDVVCSRLNTQTPFDHHNKTRRDTAHYAANYTQEMVERVAAVYKADIDLLGYDFENTSLARQCERRNQGQLLL